MSDPWKSGFSRESIVKEQKRKEEEDNKRDLENIDELINWGYSQMRIVEAWLEAAIGRNEAFLSDQDSKRIDKALIVTRTGLKMLKKVAKTRAPRLNTRAWRDEVSSVSKMKP